MGFALPALGTNTKSARFSWGAAIVRGGSASAAALSATTATTLPTTTTPAALIFPIHEGVLLVIVRVAFRRTPPPASRHHEDVFRQGSFYPGLNDYLRVAGHKWDHLNAVTGNHGPHGARNRAANQRFNSQLNQSKCFLNREFAGQDILFLVDHVPSGNFHKADVPGDVENRGNAIIPDGYGDFHRRRLLVLFDQI